MHEDDGDERQKLVKEIQLEERENLGEDIKVDEEDGEEMEKLVEMIKVEQEDGKKGRSWWRRSR